MINPKSETETREQRIFDAAAALIMRQGYDKTTIGDVADEVGVSRGIVYLHFDSKEKLFEALLQRELLQYVQTWLEYIEADPRGGTVSGIYRAVLHAINSRPLMATIMKRDRRIIGNYLRKPGNLFESMQSSSLNVEFLQALQAVGAIRQDVDPLLMSHIMDVLSYGLVMIGVFRKPEELPPYEKVMETIADMLDRLMTPDDGGNSEAGKVLIRQLAAGTKAQFEQLKPASEK